MSNRKISTRAFTLIELLLATVLSSILMLGVLMVVAGLARDRRRLRIAQNEGSPEARLLVERLRWDLANARTMAQTSDSQTLILIGHGGIDRQTLSPSGRLTRVVYRCELQDKIWIAVREQDYLDDAARPEHWRELLGVGISKLRAIPDSSDPIPPDSDDADEIAPTAQLATVRSKGTIPRRITARMKVHLEVGGGSIDDHLQVR